MSDELDNSIWDDQSWFNFNNEENEEEFKDKDEVVKMVVGETSKSAAGNGTNGDQVEKKHREAAALMPPPPPPPPPVVKGRGKKRAAAAGTSGGGNDGVPESGEHELHIWTERERRKKMKDMFTNLHALLTHLQPKADKATIVSEAAEYIKKLQETIQALEQQKLDRLLQFTAAMNNPLLNNTFINYNPFSFTVTPQNLPPTQSREALLAELGSSSGNNNNNTAAIAQPIQAANIAFPPAFRTWTSSNVILSVLGKDAHFSICCLKKTGLLTSISYVMEKYKMELITAQVSSDNNQSIFMIHARMDVASSDLFAEVEEMYKRAAAEIMCWVSS